MNQEPRCIKCKHFFVTYDQNSPRGCKAFGIKSKMIPSKVVYQSTGRHCPAFEQRIRKSQQ